MKPIVYSALLVIPFFVACSGDPSKTEQPSNTDTPASVEQPSSKTGDHRIFTLPTPVQVPTFLHIHEMKYSEDALLPVNTPEKTQNIEALAMGMYMIDFSYVSEYRHKQMSNNYAKKIRNLMLNLGVAGPFDEVAYNRIIENLEEPDTLSRLILESYEAGHQYFQSNNREGVGLLIIAGCYLEGLHLSMAYGRPNDLKSFYQVLVQQQLYLQNINALMDEFEYVGEGAKVVTALHEIQEAFSRMDLTKSRPDQKLEQFFGNKSIDLELEKVGTTVVEMRQLVQ